MQNRWTRQALATVILILGIQASALPCTAQESVSNSDSFEAFEVNYRPRAFYPKRWEKANVDFNLLAWEGNKVVFLTRKGEYSSGTMKAFVKRLDDGWGLYSELIGKQPTLFKNIKKKPTICALPKPNLSCGYGCGYLGATGIEASAFYSIDLPSFEKTPDSFQHYYFYEMGRNFFVFGDRHSLFPTGYAVFMRYVCMDTLQCVDLDKRTRQTIEQCEAIYAESDVGFFEAFTNLGSGEKNNRLQDKDGNEIAPSDPPVMYATAMLKLYRDHGGKDWTKRFYYHLLNAKPYRAKDIESAKGQVFNWLVCASAAAEQDLSSVFADRWRLPMTVAQRELMKTTNWKAANLSISKVVDELLAKD